MAKKLAVFTCAVILFSAYSFAWAGGEISAVDAVSDPSAAVGKQVRFGGLPLQKGVMDNQPYQMVIETTTGSMWTIIFDKSQSSQLKDITPSFDKEADVICTIISMEMLPKCKLISITAQ